MIASLARRVRFALPAAPDTTRALRAVAFAVGARKHRAAVAEARALGVFGGTDADAAAAACMQRGDAV